MIQILFVFIMIYDDETTCEQFHLRENTAHEEDEGCCGCIDLTKHDHSDCPCKDPVWPPCPPVCGCFEGPYIPHQIMRIEHNMMKKFGPKWRSMKYGPKAHYLEQIKKLRKKQRETPDPWIETRIHKIYITLDELSRAIKKRDELYSKL